MNEINEGKDINVDGVNEEIKKETLEDGKDVKVDNENKDLEVDEKDKKSEKKESADKGKNDKEKDSKEKRSKNKNEVEKIKGELEKAKKKNEEYFDMLQRKVAEFDNFKKRTRKEKDELYKTAFSEAVEVFLPLIDNFDRAVDAMSKDDSSKESIREGVEMISKQLNEIMKNIGVEEIKAVGENFNPELHNAMMHIEDKNYGENEVIEEFQKGYTYKGKVIRHSSVKVAN